MNVTYTRPIAALTARDAWPALFLIAIAGISWVVTVDRMEGMDMGPGTDLGAFGWFAGIWVTMMAAMMLPSLSPMAIAYSRGAAADRGPQPVAATILFAAGYLLVWAVVGAFAYLLIEGARALDLGFLAWNDAGQYVAGGVILAAGLYELTPVKARCLRHCRDARLLTARPGALGALATGVGQGGYCVGCSGGLMAALFALGVMSIGWMVLIAALIAIEKLAPWQLIPTGFSAAVLIVLGLAIMFFPDQVPGLTIPTDAAPMPMDSMSM